MLRLIIAAAFCYGRFRSRHRFRQALLGQEILTAETCLLPMWFRSRTRGGVPGDRCSAVKGCLARRSDDAARVELPVLNVTVMTRRGCRVGRYVGVFEQIQVRWSPVPSGLRRSDCRKL